MKKYFAVLLSVAFIILLGCNEAQTTADSGETSQSTVVSIEAIESETSASSYASEGSDPGAVSDTNSMPVSKPAVSASTSSRAKPTVSSSASSHAASSPASSQTTLPVDDAKRAKCNDIGSVESNGYVYFGTLFSDFEYGIYKINIKNPSDCIKLTSESAFIVRALGDYVYFINGRDELYRIGIDGKNQMRLTDKNYSRIEVAGQWIFATTSNGALYMLSTDGSKQILISRYPYERGDSKVLGFSRGYCYYEDLTYHETAAYGRIDYRSENPRPINIPYFESRPVYYRDDMLYYHTGNPYCVFGQNRLTKKERKLCEMPSESGPALLYTNHYLIAYQYRNECSFTFIDNQTAEKKAYTLDDLPTDSGYYGRTSLLDVCNESGHVYLTVNHDSQYYELIMVSPEEGRKNLFKSYK